MALSPEALPEAIRVYCANAEATEPHVTALLSAFDGLFPYTDLSESGTGHLSIKGTIPIKYSGAVFNIPLSITLPVYFPDTAPTVFVVPTKTMCIREGHALVDDSGLCIHSCLTEWNPATSTLEGVVSVLCQVFSLDPPLYERSDTVASAPPLSTSPNSSVAVEALPLKESNTQTGPTLAAAAASASAFHTSNVGSGTKTMSISQSATLNSQAAAQGTDKPPPMKSDKGGLNLSASFVDSGHLLENAIGLLNDSGGASGDGKNAVVVAAGGVLSEHERGGCTPCMSFASSGVCAVGDSCVGCHEASHRTNDSPLASIRPARVLKPSPLSEGDSETFGSTVPSAPLLSALPPATSSNVSVPVPTVDVSGGGGEPGSLFQHAAITDIVLELDELATTLPYCEIRHYLEHLLRCLRSAEKSINSLFVSTRKCAESCLFRLYRHFKEAEAPSSVVTVRAVVHDHTRGEPVDSSFVTILSTKATPVDQLSPELLGESLRELKNVIVFAIEHAEPDSLTQRESKEQKRYTGRISYYNKARGFGFLDPDDGGGEVYVYHVHAVDRRPLRRGMVVEYGLAPQPPINGRLSAVDVKILEDAPPSPTESGRVGSGSNSMLVAGPGAPRQHGILKKWFPDRDYGFVRNGNSGDDLLIHQNYVIDGTRLQERMHIEYTPLVNEKTGKLMAIDITRYSYDNNNNNAHMLPPQQQQQQPYMYAANNYGAGGYGMAPPLAMQPMLSMPGMQHGYPPQQQLGFPPQQQQQHVYGGQGRGGGYDQHMGGQYMQQMPVNPYDYSGVAGGFAPMPAYPAYSPPQQQQPQQQQKVYSQQQNAMGGGGYPGGGGGGQSGTRRCMICQTDGSADVAFVPCGHMCVCAVHSSAASHCPMCGVFVEKTLKIQG